MARNLLLQLENSVGLMKVVVCTGLKHPMVIHPIIHSEPLLTAQAFYYASEMESVVHFRFTDDNDSISEEELEYLTDNYLFEYSKAHPESKITSKVMHPKFLAFDPGDMYLMADAGHTRTLALDVANDPAVQWIKAVDPTDSVDLSNWNIGQNYVAELFEPYADSLGVILQKKVSVFVLPDEYRDGYIGKLRILKPEYGLMQRFQAEALEYLSIDAIPSSAETVELKASDVPEVLQSLPVERLNATKQFSPILLSHYFSGLKEFNPLKAFIGFYNVLEYYFEEAPRILEKSAETELEQLHCVIDLLSTSADVEVFLNTLDLQTRSQIHADLQTSSSRAIPAFSPATVDQNCFEAARWLYDIRCAIVHSKKTRKGSITAAFEPYSRASKNVEVALPLIRWLAVLCIEKDYSLTRGALD